MTTVTQIPVLQFNHLSGYILMQRHVQIAFCFFLILQGSLPMYSQQPFTILGSGDRLQTGDSIFLSYKQHGKYVLQVTTVNDKRFAFTGHVAELVKANLYRNENPEKVNLITESVQLYLESGVSRVDYRHAAGEAVVSGTRLNDTLQLLQNELIGLVQQRMRIKDPDYFTEVERRDTALVRRNKSELERIFYSEADIKLAFAARYPKSYVSLDVLHELSRLNSYIFKIEDLFSRLPEHLRQTQTGVVIRERIQKKKQVLPGVKAVDFTLPDNHNNLIKFSSFTGRYVLLDFWASWCGPCREEHPNLKLLYERYKNNGLVIVSVSLDTDKQKWLRAIEKDGLMWPQLSDLKGNQSHVYLAYGITSIPANFLINPDGEVVAKDLKGDALKNKLGQIFPKQ